MGLIEEFIARYHNAFARRSKTIRFWHTSGRTI